MPLTVLSPFSGRPVKVRDQDVGRAVRDEENRIFYVVPKSDGSGYYAAPTRKGSEKDEQRYAELEAKTDQSAQQVKAEHAAVHDATGPGRSGGGGKFLLLLILIVVAAIAIYLLANGTQGLPFIGEPGPTQPEDAPADEAPGSPTDGMDGAYDHTQPRVNPEALALMQSIRSSRAGSESAGPRVIETADDPAVSATPEPRTTATDGTRLEPDALETARQRILNALDKSKPFTRTASDLRYRVEEIGIGDRARAQDYVLIHYSVAHYRRGGTSRLLDSSRDGNPVGFVLWSGQVIRGWDEGIAGMREGERRTLIIPPDLAGATGQTTAHGELPEANLLCEVELVEVRQGVTHLVNRVGAGRLAYPGDTVELHYTATIDGQEKPFDDSYAYGQPLRFTIGAGEVITGLELGTTGMAVGETRTITIPSYLGYGRRGAGSLIPPDSDLSYTVELLRVIED